MKRIISLALITLLTISFNINGFSQEAIPQLKGLGSGIYDGELTKREFKAYGNGSVLIDNIDFTDIKGNSKKEDIYKLGALSIIKGYENNKFLPNKKVTREEAIIMIVRMLGLEGEVQRNIAQNSEDVKGSLLNMIIREEYAQMAQNRGIITEEDNYNLTAFIDRETALLWISNLLDIEPTYNDISIIYGYRDYKDFSYENIGLMETLLKEGIYFETPNNRLYPKKAITRAEMAKLLSQVINKLYDKMDIRAYDGMVVDIKREVNQYGDNTATNTTLTLTNIDGSLSSIKLSKETPSIVTEDIATYKNGRIYGAKVLDIGDQLQYLVKDNEVIYMAVKNDGAIVKKIKEKSLEMGENFKSYEGTIVLKVRETHWDDNSFYYVNRFTIRNKDEKEYDFIIEEDPQGLKKNDIIVFKNNKAGNSGLLEEGDEIEYLVKDDKYILFIYVKDIF